MTGYTVRSEGRPCPRERIVRVSALVLAVVLAGLALALFASSLSMSEPLGWAMAIIFAAGAALVFDFGCRHRSSIVEVDRAAAELREIGWGGRVAARHPFAGVSGLFIDETRGPPTLVLRLGSSPQVVPVAFGSRAELSLIATRLSRDILDTQPERSA
ncbi:MAG: hypothetical protein H3C51_09920 [Rubellimicrobium sp.]|nr:hypothetical protein [Rubellimicrobium sp.]